jgi:spore coat protein A
MSDPVRTPDIDLSRRNFLVATGTTGISTIAGCLSSEANQPTSDDGQTPSEQSLSKRHTSPELERWVEEVPRPRTKEPTGTKDGHPYYEIEMHEFEQKVHPDLPETTVWGYDGYSPGPTIEATQGEPIYVRWQNKLPDTHLLPEDTTIHSDIIPYNSPGVRTVPHLHGGNVEPESDGKAQGWFTRDFEETGPKFEKKDYYYVNDQPPATLWYHDHSVGITRLNVYAGLAGFYLLRSEHEQSLGLPQGEYEIPLVLQDRSFNEDGSLYYPIGTPDSQGGEGSSQPETSIVPQFYGDISVVNGKAWPKLSVEPRKYRLRILNGANSRYYNLKLLEYDKRSGETGQEGPPFVQIGNDGGLLSNPVETPGRLELSSSQRADVIVDFSEYAGESLLLHNNAPAMYRGTTGIESGDTEPLSELMRIDVKKTEGDQDETVIPDELTSVPEIPIDSVDNKRYLTLLRQTDDYDRPLYLLGTQEEQSGSRLTDPVTEAPTLGDTELWSIANHTGMSHPIHLHLVHFQILGRQQSRDYDPVENDIDMDALEDPQSFELGWNDVVSVDPGEVVHLITHFGEYEGLFNDQTGEYMWHCHMIEHEDHDMMRPFTVLQPE